MGPPEAAGLLRSQAISPSKLQSYAMLLNPSSGVHIVNLNFESLWQKRYLCFANIWSCLDACVRFKRCNDSALLRLERSSYVYVKDTGVKCREFCSSDCRISSGSITLSGCCPRGSSVAEKAADTPRSINGNREFTSRL